MILKIDDAKKLIDLDVSDAVLEKMLDATECFIRKYTNNNFQVREIRSHSAILDDKIVSPPIYISVGDTVQISGSLLNNGLYVVTNIDNNGLNVDRKLWDCEKNIITKVKYPEDVIIGVVNMIKWDAENRDRMGVQSEKISRHSVTYININESAVMGYPKAVLGFLKPYMKGRF